MWAAALVLGTAGMLQAQEFNIGSVPVQVHGFASQGFAKSDENNYLTMNTRDGSAALLDGGINASAKFGRKLLVGAQVYTRNFGNLGQGDVTVDWAQADFRMTSWLGVRAGKVKTVMGLYNDTQDMEFLQTFALLPQGVYPTDLRDGTIAHTGADVYGRVDFDKLGGGLVYTAYIGDRRDTYNGGYPYMLRGVGIDYTNYGGRQIGGGIGDPGPADGGDQRDSHLGQECPGVWRRVVIERGHGGLHAPIHVRAVVGIADRRVELGQVLAVVRDQLSEVAHPPLENRRGDALARRHIPHLSAGVLTGASQSDSSSSSTRSRVTDTPAMSSEVM